jgi:UDP-N-acetyl-D-glucosamine 4,6-dehydratase
VYKNFTKRVFDFLASGIGLILLMPLFIIVAIWIKLNSKGPIFFVQKRVGQNFKEFNLYKFRTMVAGADKKGPLVTSGDDPRVTKIGKILRRTKIDELPQLFNVFTGNMSLVGPRPEVKKYVMAKENDYKEVLKVKPGITDNAAIVFRDEEALMEKFEDKEKGYLQEVLPKKIELYLKYIKNISFTEDMSIIFKTFFAADVLLPTNAKRAIFYIIGDILFTLVATYFAFLLRFDFAIPSEYYVDIFKAFVALSAIKVALFNAIKLYKVSWRHFGFRDHTRVIYALVASTITFILLVYLFRGSLFSGFPRAVVPIEFFISLFLFLAFRGSRRYVLERVQKNAFGKPTLIVANLDDADEIIRRLYRFTKEYKPFVVLNNENKGIRVNGVNVFDFATIKELFDGLEVAIVSKEYDINDIYEKLKELNINEIKVYKSLDDDISFEDISVEDLLARKPKDIDTKKIESFIKDKRVLITGAGGSIGSELSRVCAKFNAKELLLLDNSEYNLYKIEQELQSHSIKPLLVNIVNKNDLEGVFKDSDIDIVLHAAAYKHVPLVEANPDSAIKNNIVGTKNVIDLAIKYSAQKVVLISTDKAVRPTNIMGATKRVCELYAQNVHSDTTEIVAVRFGNVLGSSGSVIPKFKEQIKNGGPITVTHPEITRYFMLIPEACLLVLQAASIGKGRELFILDMGEPIKIVDLAKKMIELSAKKDIEIKFTGLRAGEKLYEELLINQSDKKTQYESITVAAASNYDFEKLNQDIKELILSKEKIAKLKDIVPEFNHNCN